MMFRLSGIFLVRGKDKSKRDGGTVRETYGNVYVYNAYIHVSVRGMGVGGVGG